MRAIWYGMYGLGVHTILYDLYGTVWPLNCTVRFTLLVLENWPRNNLVILALNFHCVHASISFKICHMILIGLNFCTNSLYCMVNSHTVLYGIVKSPYYTICDCSY